VPRRINFNFTLLRFSSNVLKKAISKNNEKSQQEKGDTEQISILAKL
jgi:hypothetical protein